MFRSAKKAIFESEECELNETLRSSKLEIIKNTFTTWK